LSVNATVAEWKALLAYGESLVDRMAETKLSEITSFCNGMVHVYLPPPDTTDLNQKMDSVMSKLLRAVEACRSDHAYVMDALFSDPEDWEDEGVDTDAVRRLVETAVECAPCILDWAYEQRRQLDAVEEWQRRVELALTPSAEEDGGSGGGGGGGGELVDLEHLLQAARRTLAFRSMAQVALEQRIDRAYDLRGRIRALLDPTAPREALKVLGSVVREVAKLRVTFPEARLLATCHQQAEAWVDRANVVRGVVMRKRVLFALPDLTKLCHDLYVFRPSVQGSR
jgi:hypothetical protein